MGAAPSLKRAREGPQRLLTQQDVEILLQVSVLSHVRIVGCLRLQQSRGTLISCLFYFKCVMQHPSEIDTADEFWDAVVCHCEVCIGWWRSDDVVLQIS